MKVLVFLKTLLTVDRLGCGAPDGWALHVPNRSHIFGVKEDDSRYTGRARRKSKQRQKCEKKRYGKESGMVMVVVVEGRKG